MLKQTEIIKKISTYLYRKNSILTTHVKENCYEIEEFGGRMQNEKKIIYSSAAKFYLHDCGML